MKKAQLEILGLAVIVLLVGIGMLLMIKFVVLKPAEDIKSPYSHSQLASNLVNSMLKTNTDCRNLDVSEVIQDCATYTSYCGSTDSCTYLFGDIDNPGIIGLMLNQTLNSWSKSYVMTGMLNGNLEFQKSNGLCSRNMPKQSKTFIIPTDVGDFNIKLDICT